ncbi:MAG: Hsp33 family molecular chaperone HslO [Oscillospiraceae bacterium]|nr:Hsp33 family molecular chaperone HslO [Oscillospiraceae bacterium]
MIEIISMDQIVKAISEDGFVSISVINSKSLTQQAKEMRNCTPVVTAALGRTLAAASIIGSSMKKAGASLTIRIDGGGPIGSVIVVSDDEGNVRGYVSNPHADVPKRADGKLNVGGVVGKDGMLSVIRDFGGREPYTGASALVSGEIAEDFAAYFAASEQVPSACAFGVLVGRDRSVLAAGGYIVQLLPGAPGGVIDKVESNVGATGAVTDVLFSGGADALLESVMSGFSPKVIERMPVEYRCTCNRERFLTAVLSLSKGEIDEMVAEGEPIEVCCQFCDHAYVFEISELGGSLL